MRKYVVIVREGEAEVHRQVLFVGTYAFVLGNDDDLRTGKLIEVRTSDAPEMPERSL